MPVPITLTLTRREALLVSFALWQLASAARDRAFEAAQKTYKGPPDHFKQFADDARDAEALYGRVQALIPK